MSDNTRSFSRLKWPLIDTFGLAISYGFVIGLGHWSLSTPILQSEINTLIAYGLFFLLGTSLLYRPKMLMGFRSMAHALPLTISLFGLVVLAIVIFRIEYSRPILLVCFIWSIVWFQLRLALALRYSKKKFWVVPQDSTAKLMALSGRVKFKSLEQPEYMQSVNYNDGVIVDMHHTLSDAWNSFLSDLTMRKIPVYDAAFIYEAVTGRVSLNYIRHQLWNILPLPKNYLRFKRMGDIVLSIILLIMLFPFMLLCSLLIAYDSSGGVLFTQKRIGMNGAQFNMLKFRTMNKRTSNKQYTASTQPQDSRITTVGAMLRYFHLDELPQLWNVLKGDMSLVGPRPAIADIEDKNARNIAYYQYRHIIQPGITGWAQVSQGYALDEDLNSTKEKIERDFYYIKHLSLGMDIMVMILTVFAVISGKGAR